MGVFDIPAPLFGWLDGHMSSFAPATLRLVLWGIVGAIVSMGLYWALSPQKKIAGAKTEGLEARRALDGYDGEFKGAMTLIRNMLRLAFKQIGLVVGPAVIASLPLLFLIVWMSTAYGSKFPAPHTDVEIHTFPEQLEAQWLGAGEVEERRASRLQTKVRAEHGLRRPGEIEEGPTTQAQTPRIIFPENQYGVMRSIPLPVPVTTIHKHQWWNVLFGNPAGYLPDEARIDRIKIDLPAQEFLPFGPSWLRSWEVVFFTALILGSVAIKVAFRIK